MSGCQHRRSKKKVLLATIRTRIARVSQSVIVGVTYGQAIANLDLVTDFLIEVDPEIVPFKPRFDDHSLLIHVPKAEHVLGFFRTAATGEVDVGGGSGLENF